MDPTASYVLNLELTDALIKSVYRRRFMRGPGRMALTVAVILGGMGLLLHYLEAVETLVTSLLTFALTFFLLFVFGITSGPAQSVKAFARMRDRTVTYTFTLENFMVVSELWETTYSWRVLTGVVRWKDVWLLLLTDERALVIPADQVTPGLHELLLEKVEGGWD